MKRTTDIPAILTLDSWAGRTAHQVRVIGRTKTKVRIVLMEDVTMPGARAGRVGDVFLVPARSVEFTPR